METNFFRLPALRKYFVAMLCGFCLTAQAGAGLPTFDWLPKEKRPDLSWVKSVGAYSFPKGKSVTVNAVGDGKTLCTKQIQDVIDRCASQGGGVVEFAPGDYLTGAIYVKSGVELRLGQGVILRAVTDIEQFPPIDTRVAGIEMQWPSAVINILGQKNAAVTGPGRIECQGQIYWEKYWEMRRNYEARGLRWIVDYDCQRVRGILVSRSEDITLRGFTLRQPGFWAVQLLYSNRCTVGGVTLQNNVGGRGPSTDGIDIDSSTRILVENCDVDCNDDNICLKAGRDWDGLRVNRPTQYVVIRNCTVYRGAGLVTCGSETSGGISDILCYDSRCEGASAAIRFKSALTRGGYIRNIWVSGVEVTETQTAVVAEMNWNPSYSYSELPEGYNGKPVPAHWQTMLKKVTPKEKGYPKISDIYIANLHAESCAGSFLSIQGMSEQQPVRNLWLYNITGNAARAGSIKNTENVSLQKVSAAIRDGSRIDMAANRNMTGAVDYQPYENPASPFVHTLQGNDPGRTVVACNYPELALLWPHMAGNFKLGVIVGNESFWLKDADMVKTVMQGKKLVYDIEDKTRMAGSFHIEVWPLGDSDGFIMEVTPSGTSCGMELFWAFGGAAGQVVNEAPLLRPAWCKDNTFSVEGNAFTLYYGGSMANLKVLQGLVPPASDIRLSDAAGQGTPAIFLLSGKKTASPALTASMPLENGKKYYFCFYRQNAKADYNYFMLPELWARESKL